MKYRGVLTILLLIALMLMLGGVRRSTAPEQHRADPVRLGAETLAAVPGKGDAAEWTAAARKNPVWFLRINSEPL